MGIPVLIIVDIISLFKIKIKLKEQLEDPIEIDATSWMTLIVIVIDKWIKKAWHYVIYIYIYIILYYYIQRIWNLNGIFLYYIVISKFCCQIRHCSIFF